MKVFLERTRTRHHRRHGGLPLVAGAAAAAWIAMLASAPTVHADVAVLPDLPQLTADQETGALGVPPLWDGVSYSGTAFYTDLLGDTVGSVSNPEPEVLDEYSLAPGTIWSSGLTATEFLDTNEEVASVANNVVAGSTYDFASTTSGWDNYYELTPSYVNGATSWTDNINDALVYAPNSSIDFGVQYVDLPDASTPVDAINVLGSGGDILLSIPVIGDLFSSL
jgi:hypothetical protein